MAAGEWSYSLYLSHILVFFLIARVATDMRYRFNDLSNGVTSAIALVVAAAPASWIRTSGADIPLKWIPTSRAISGDDRAAVAQQP
jgi:peptidoglycan/LPS O-acetylase OafA/YrhL